MLTAMRRDTQWKIAVIMTLAAFGWSFAGYVMAYDKENHEILTQLAVEKYNTCRPGGAKIIKGPVAKALAKCAAKEDRRDAHRIFHWHFFPEEGKSLRVPPIFRWIVKSNNALNTIAEIEAKLAKASSDAAKVQLLGQAVHYLQDATNPSHTLPALHGSLFGPDWIDKARVDETVLRKTLADDCDLKDLRLSESAPPGNQNDTPKLEEIGKEAASASRIAASPYIGDRAKLQLWQVRNDENASLFSCPDGWYCYGACGRDEKSAGLGCGSTESLTEFDAFVLQLHKAAVNATYKALTSKKELFERLGNQPLRECETRHIED
jgi:hypothetical protein